MIYAERVFRLIYLLLITCSLLGICAYLFDLGKDATDPRDGRSGLGLYTDSGTGCQYLKAGLFGGITPRLRKDGTQLCGAVE